ITYLPITSLRSLGSHNFQRTSLRLSSAFEVHTCDELFVSWRKFLLHDEFVSFEYFALVIYVGGFELDLIICEFIAVVTSSDNPARICRRQFRTEFRVGDHNVLCGIRPPEHCDQAIAVLPYSKNEDDADKKQPPDDDPLP